MRVLHGLSPIEVTPANAGKLYKEMYLDGERKESKKYSYKIGDSVRVLLPRTGYKRAYDPTFTNEIYSIAQSIHTNPHKHIRRAG